MFEFCVLDANIPHPHGDEDVKSYANQSDLFAQIMQDLPDGGHKCGRLSTLHASFGAVIMFHV